MKHFLYLILLINSYSHSQTNLIIDSTFFRTQVSSFSPQGIEYYKVPSGIIDSLEFSALVSNTSILPITGCYINVRVVYNNMELYNISSTEISLPAQSQDSIFITAKYKIPEVIGDYTIIYKLYSDANEFVNNLNNKYVAFEITNNQLSRHNGFETSETELLLQSNIGVGYTFELDESACLSSALVWTTTTSYDWLVQVRAELWEQNKVTGEFTRILFSEPMVPGLLGNMNPVQMNFPSSYLLEADKRYYIGVFNEGNSSTRIKYAQATEENNVFKMVSENTMPGGVDWTIVDADTSLLPMIEIGINNSGNCFNQLPKNEQSDDVVFPNPFDNELKVVITERCKSITIFDVSGKLVYSKANFNESNLIINTSNFETGVYFYHLLDENESLINQGKIIKQ